MTADFTIKRNDWGASEPLRARLSQLAVNPTTGEVEHDSEGNPKFNAINLTTAEAVRLIFAGKDGLDFTTDPITITDAATGAVEYQFKDAEGEKPADLGTEDTYRFEFEITWPDGVQTVPNSGYYELLVEEDLGPVEE